MPSLQTIRDGIAQLPNRTPLVIALVGGTTGIGTYVAKALATTFAAHGDKLRVYVIGRRPDRAEEVVAFGRATSPGSDWRFIQAHDLSLMSDVDRVCAEITQQEESDPFAGGKPRLDVLYMSQALSPMQASAQTKEGLDTQMSLLYYSRIRTIQRLTPLLLASPEPSHVISIYAGSVEGAHTPDALPIGTPSPERYGITAVRNHSVFMKTFMFEELAARHAGKIAFVHVYPGLVDGPTFYSDVNPLWFRVLWRVLKSLVSWYMTSPETCGTVMVFLATGRFPAKGNGVKGADVAFSTQRERGGGAYAVGMRGDENKKVSYENVRTGDTGSKVWEHTIEVLDGIDKKQSGA
ncbi:hypothetical protein CC86DRAFT_370099 [Ophiobolus disseminans]|uniref:NAD(P)-binding protein n=1 Tax=Ophiobolus disseminans TaxID=1469910 RepID=A0A6A7A2N5_9PLEO|nr:hypothetical protein CC86DRAFT_370099 [Ophiobolus disseminans]